PNQTFTADGAGKLVRRKYDPDAIQGLEIRGHYGSHPDAVGNSWARIAIASAPTAVRSAIRGLKLDATIEGVVEAPNSLNTMILGHDNYPICESDIRAHF